MFTDDFFPISTNPVVVLVEFVLMLLVMHVVFVWIWPLTKVGWKQADYYWLGFAALGLFTGATQARQLAANGVAGRFVDTRASASYESAKQLVDLYARDDGALCRKYVRSEWSPPPEVFDRLQQQSDLACAWVKRLSGSLPAETPDAALPQSLIETPAEISDAYVLSIFKDIRYTLLYFNANAVERDRIRQAAQKTEVEVALTFVSPLLLAVALALRFTKVTGEIRLECRSRAPAIGAHQGSAAEPSQQQSVDRPPLG